MGITANTETDTKTDSMSGTAVPLVFHIMIRDTERALCGETVCSRPGHAHGKGEPPATMAWNYCPLCWEECKRRLHKTNADYWQCMAQTHGRDGVSIERTGARRRRRA